MQHNKECHGERGGSGHESVMKSAQIVNANNTNNDLSIRWTKVLQRPQKTLMMESITETIAA